MDAREISAIKCTAEMIRSTDGSIRQCRMVRGFARKRLRLYRNRGLIRRFEDAARLINMSVGATFVFAAMLMAWLRSYGFRAPSSVGVGVAAAVVVSCCQERFLLRELPRLILW